MVRKSGFFFLTATLFLSFCGGVWAQEAKAEKPKDFPDFAEVVTEEYKKTEGFYTIYKHQEKEIAYLEIPAGTLEQDFLVATTIAGGSLYTGFQWSDALLYWKRYDKKLALLQRQLRYRAGDASSPLGQSVARTYKDTLISTYSIATLNGGNPVLEMSSVVLDDIGTFFGYGFHPGNSALAKYVQLKSFPENTEVSVEFPDAWGEFITLHYSFRSLPASDFQAREADERIGYFLTVHKDFTNGKKEENLFVRYINRWNLKKQDPELAKSPVVHPIIFYIEKTVPVKYRQAVREGIAEWNKAFESIGYLNAIEVRQQTDTNEFKDLDPADSRYNFFRWITSGQGFAMGPSRVDPRTGEILDADIIFDDDMLRWSLSEFDVWIREEAARKLEPRIHKHFDKYQEAQKFLSRAVPQAGETEEVCHLSETDRMIQKVIESGKWKAQRPLCMMGKGKSHELRLANAYFSSVAKEEGTAPVTPKEKTWPEDFIHQVIKETVMHEVGHTLGLRHNFKGSSWRSLSEINSTPAPQISGSVMDYNPINIKGVAKEAVQGNYQMTTLGAYDYWAIDYGYNDKADATKLAEIASRCAEAGLAYGTDEDVWSPDPLIKAWELGNDPVAYAKHRVDLAKLLLTNIEKRSLKKGDSYDQLTNIFSTALFEHAFAGSLALTNLGGAHINYDRYQDPNGRDPLVLVSAQKQREALTFVCETIFAPEAFQFKPELLTKLAPSHWLHWGTRFRKNHSFNVYDEVAFVQWWVFVDIFSSEMLHRIYNNELKSSEKEVLTLPEVFSSVRGAIWAELGRVSTVLPTNHKPLVNGYRRNLQREHLETLIKLAMEGKYGWSPVAARTLAWDELRSLKSSIDHTLKNTNLSQDAYTRAHLEEASTRIQKALDAAYTRD